MSEPDESAATPPAPPAPDAPAPAAAAEVAAPAALDDPQVRGLRAAVDHFMAGNFAASRRALVELKRGQLRPEIAQQADELLRRMGLDPVAIWVLVGSALLFVFVLVMAYRH